MRRLIDAVVNDESRPWTAKSRNQLVKDANAIFEALLLTDGLDAAMKAFAEQGVSLKGQYKYAAEPLYDMAMQLRLRRESRRDSKS